jgi:uncharacterized phage-associated protein
MCDLYATIGRIFLSRPLKRIMTVTKLAFCYYNLSYEGIRDKWGTHSREASVPLKFRPKLDKILELLVYLAHARPGADKYQAVKFLYFADREHFARYGRPITFENYYALWYGPVASNALDLLNQNPGVMKRFGIKSLPFEIEKGTVKTKAGKETETVFIRKPLREVNKELFSKSDFEVFDEVLAKYGNADFDALYNETHKHFAYENAWNTRRHGDHAQMFYDEMIDDLERRKALVEDLSPVAAKM